VSLIELNVYPRTINISQGRTVYSTGDNGFIEHREHGLFVHETRLISKYCWKINGEKFLPVSLSNVNQHSWLGYYIQHPSANPEKKEIKAVKINRASQHSVEMTIARYVGGGVHEDIDITNYSGEEAEFNLEFEIDADFADWEETRSRKKIEGGLSKKWKKEDVRTWHLVYRYRASHDYNHQGNKGHAEIDRGVTIEILHPGSAPNYRDDSIVFKIKLKPQEAWHTCVNIIPRIEQKLLISAYDCGSFEGIRNEYDRRRRIFLNEATQFETPGKGHLTHIVQETLDRAKEDLVSLRLYDIDKDERAWMPAAGLPVYVAIFGRDSLTAAWQSAITSTAIMRGTLEELARWQGGENNDWRDEQPGRMIHEAHTGPLAILNFNPRQKYYGSITASGFYPAAAAELWHWTGDKKLIAPLIEPAVKAIKWLDKYARESKKGFYSYKTRSEQGLKNQSWKDSGDSTVYPDGRQVEAPHAACEEQAFAYVAKLHFSETLWWMGRKDEAKRIYREAGELKKRFNEEYWMEDEEFFAMGLDKDGRQIKTVSSNPGNCLSTGLCRKDLAERVCRRLFKDDLFSGWGIRTLSSVNPAYNPYSYHRGAVWPVEQGPFALGMMRYGLRKYASILGRAMFEAASFFKYRRLPELFSGHQKDENHPFPAIYPQANTPQAWSASTVFTIIQSLLGLYPYAPLNILFIDPKLPEWLPEITLRNLRVGKAVVTIKFIRKNNGKSTYRVLSKRGPLHIVRQPTPWSVTAGFGERLFDFASQFAPSKGLF